MTKMELFGTHALLSTALHVDYFGWENRGLGGLEKEGCSKKCSQKEVILERGNWARKKKVRILLEESCGA